MNKFRSGVERKIDPMGRIVIPAEIRDLLGLTGGEPLDISVRDGAIVLAPLEERCAFCGRLRRDRGDSARLHAVPEAVVASNSSAKNPG